jgi:hypothetical protein
MITTTIVSGSGSSSSQNENGFDDRLATRCYLRSGWLKPVTFSYQGPLAPQAHTHVLS